MKLFPILNEGCLTCGHELCARKVSLFSSLDDEQLVEIVNLIERHTYKKGETILHEGDIFNRLFIINKGSMKASTFQEDGKEQIIYLLHEGDSIGELALLKEDRATFTIKAITDLFLCTISKKKFDEYIMDNPAIMQSIILAAHHRISSLERLVSALASNDADIRLKYLLKRLCEEQGLTDKKVQTIHLSITREDMANFVGVTRETISRKLAQLVKDEVIAFEGTKKLQILDTDYFFDDE